MKGIENKYSMKGRIFMKKLLSIIISVFIMMNMMYVFAEEADYTKVLENSAADIEEYITTSLENLEVDSDKIDKSHILAIHYVSFISIERNSMGSYVFVMVPMIDSDDVYICSFEEEEFKGIIEPELGEQVLFFKNYKVPYENVIEEYVESNNIPVPDKIRTLYIAERIQMLAFEFVCSDEKYIIPYYSTGDYEINVTHDEKLELEMGKAYTQQEFLDICYEEQEIYSQYIKEQNEESDTPYVTVNEDGDDVLVDGENEYTVNESEETNKKIEEILSGLDNKEDTQKDNEKSDLEDTEKTDGNKTEDENKSEDENQSSDTENEESKNEIVPLSEEDSAAELKKYEIMIGDPDGNMRLESFMTRAEAMILILRSLDKDYADTQLIGETPYIDIADHWAYEDIKHALSLGLISGTSETTIEPDREVIKEEFIKMIVNALGYQPDADSLGGYPDGYVKTAESLGLLNGVDTLAQTPITRGEAAVMLNNALDIPIMQTTGMSFNGEYLTPDYEIMNGENGTELITLKIRRER